MNLQKGCKVIYHNANKIDIPDDPRYRYKIEIVLRPPSFMEFAFVGLYGATEKLIIRCKSKKYVDGVFKELGIRNHPRLIEFVVSDSKGIIERSGRKT